MNYNNEDILTLIKSDEGSTNLAFWWTDQNGNEVKWTFKELSQLSQRLFLSIHYDLSITYSNTTYQTSFNTNNIHGY